DCNIKDFAGKFLCFDCDGDGDIDILAAGKDAANNSFISLYLNDNGIFSESNQQFESLENMTAGYADIDGDGDYDLLLAGHDFSGAAKSILYLNNNGSFTKSEYNLPALKDPAILLADFNNDGQPDLALSGSDSSGKAVTKLYYNNSGKFFDSGKNLIGVKKGCLAAFDFDSDGYSDLLSSGETDNSRRTTLHLNENGKFENMVIGLPGLTNPSAASGDFNGDGTADLILCGASIIPITKIYKNENGGLFEINSIITSLSDGGSAFGDFDADGDLDLAMTGKNSAKEPMTIIYTNKSVNKNMKPDTPSNLTSKFSAADSILTLSWESDNKNNNLTYNLRIGITPNGNEIMPSMSAEDGRRLIAAEGNCGRLNSVKIKNIKSGRYYWSVQAINSAFNASEFASEKIFSTPDMAQEPPASWQYERQTGENSHFLIKSDINTQDNFYKLNAGDAVGVFYDTDSSLKCAGYSKFDNKNNIAITAWGDNRQTVTTKDGFDSREQIRFKIWDAGQGIEMPAAVELESGITCFLPDTLSVIKRFIPLSSLDISIEKDSWAMVSSYIEPFYSFIDSLIPKSVISIETGEGLIFNPNKGLRDFNHLTFGKAYWIYSSNSDTIHIKGGAPNSEDYPINLENGIWQIIPYLLPKAYSADIIFNDIKSKLLIAMNSNGQLYIPKYNFNQIDEVRPGEALRVFMTDTASLVYSLQKAESAGTGIAWNKKPEHFKYIFNQTGNYSYLIIESTSFNDGDEAAVISNSGKIAGSSVVKNGRAIITISGDNLITDNFTEGPQEGQPLSLKYYSNEENSEYELGVISITDFANGRQIQGNLKFLSDNILHIMAVKGKPLSVDIPNTESGSNFNLCCKPNPCAEFISVNYDLAYEAFVSAALYDCTGRIVMNLFNGFRESGENEFKISTEGISNGSYFFELTCGKKTDKFKIIIRK
ncbi:MAG: hypothetical protein QG635_1467, partial [Bacteroidota bacterium]|nr:hypothetical protein [Bacteroidota bacterium]